MATSAKQVLPITRWSATGYWTIEKKSILMLCFSLCFFGFGDALLVRSGLGSTPWTILSQGIAKQTGLTVGTITFLTSCCVMLAWLPLKLKVGLGTLLNVSLIPLSLDLALLYIEQPVAMHWRLLYALSGTVIIGICSAFYLTCYMGAGPRDGLMVGLCQRYQLRVGIVRTLLEGLAALLGFLLGGTLGFATLFFAVAVGWVLQIGLYFMRQCGVNKQKI